MGSNGTDQTHRPSHSKNEREYMEEMANSILLLATLVATATYSAGFNPPGGVWQETPGHLPGDPIIRSTQYVRYWMFFYCNATAFASSFMVVVLTILFMIIRDQKNPRIIVIPLVLVTLLGLLSLIGAYAAGTFQDVFTAIFTSLLAAAVFTYVAVEKVLAYLRDKGSNSNKVASSPDPGEETHNRVPDPGEETHNRRPPHNHFRSKVLMMMQLATSSSKPDEKERRNREVLMQLATFALTAMYGSGLSIPGGFSDSTDGGYRPGDIILKGARPTVFFVFNTTAFVASLLMVLVLLLRKIRHMKAVYAGSILMLSGFLSSYSFGSSSQEVTLYVGGLILVASVYLGILASFDATHSIGRLARNNNLCEKSQDLHRGVSRQEREKRAHSTYVEFLANLASTITYVAGLHPPGGIWQDDGDGHKAGDPILQTTNLKRYNAFFYCNSVAFVASLVCMILVQLKKPRLKHRALEQAMILDLLGLVGSYAFGSCRAETTTVYTMGIGGAALVYVVLHVALLDHDKDDTDGRKKEDEDHHVLALDRMGYGFFLFAIFVATITYQAGLTPPGGFLLKDDESGNHAGDPVLLHNYPRRYRVFFYCNSASFMVSIAVIILLVNPKLYRPAIKTHALSVCTAVNFFCLLAAFAAGTTQHLKTSIYTLVLLAVVLCSAVLLILIFFLRSFMSSSSAPAIAKDKAKTPIPTSSEERNAQAEDEAIADPPIDLLPANSSSDNNYHYPVITKRERDEHASRIYIMTVGILVASVTYQAGLDPPGGSWQASYGHKAGYPVMYSNMRQRYLAFSFSNSTSFVASIFIMIQLLLGTTSTKHIYMPRPLMFINTMIMIGLLGLFGAYATGSNRGWKTSLYVVVIFFSVLAYFSVLLVLSFIADKGGDKGSAEEPEN